LKKDQPEDEQKIGVEGIIRSGSRQSLRGHKMTAGLKKAGPCILDFVVLTKKAKLSSLEITKGKSLSRDRRRRTQ